MNLSPVSANSLGLRNPHHYFGCTDTVIGGVVAVLTLVRFVGSLVAPIEFWEWPFLIMLLGYAARRIYVGLRLIVHGFVDALGPGPISRADHTIAELLEHKRIWTYGRPQGLVAELLHQLTPGLNYLTPPFQALRDGSVHQITIAVLAFLALLATPYLGWATVPLLLVATVALAIRMTAIRLAVGYLSGDQPAVEVYDGKEHLTEAGNPIDFFNSLCVATESLQERGYRNRVLFQKPPAVGSNATTNRCEADLVLETQPVPLTDQRSTSRTVLLLDIGGAALECLGVAILLAMLPGYTTFSTAFLLFMAALVAWDAGTRFRLLAQGLLCTFRFRSDLFWLRIEGSYVVNEVAVGGGLNGFVSTKGQAFRSDLFVKVYGTRIISECGPPLRGFFARLWGNPSAAEAVLQYAPRYVLSAHLDPDYQDRLRWLLGQLRTYRDQSENLRAPNLDSQRMSQLVSQNLSVAQMLGAATAQGTVMGQHQATQLISGNPVPQPVLATVVQAPLPPGGLPAPVPVPVPPIVPATSPPQMVAPPKPKVEVVRWNCHQCGKELKAAAEHAGKRAKCTQCSTPQVIPTATSHS